MDAETGQRGYIISGDDRFLEPDGWSHPGGLIARAFQAGSPFEGQELYFVAPEGRVFAARCAKARRILVT